MSIWLRNVSVNANSKHVSHQFVDEVIAEAVNH